MHAPSSALRKTLKVWVLIKTENSFEYRIFDRLIFEKQKLKVL